MDPCNYCGFGFVLSLDRCPHCAQPGLFPNVRAAQQPGEMAALDQRYARAIEEANARGCRADLAAFEQAVSHASKAVIARPIEEIHRLAVNDRELYTTYYKLIESEIRVPHGDKWDTLRRVADEALFPGHKQQIRFAALSLDGLGLTNYGDFSMVLRDNMIGHRASAFEENCVLFMDHKAVRMADVDRLPCGYRAVWNRRGNLAVAKLGCRINQTTRATDFSELLLRQGATSAQDEFIEVHIFWPMTIRTIERVVVKRKKRQPRKAILLALREELARFDVSLEER